MKFSRYSNIESDFSLIDWPLIRARHWANTESDLDRLRRRQAEFLIHRFVPWELVNGIGVFDDDILEQVEGILEGVSHCPRVRVLKEWYYD
jgi:hypothetical protein